MDKKRMIYMGIGFLTIFAVFSIYQVGQDMLFQDDYKTSQALVDQIQTHAIKHDAYIQDKDYSGAYAEDSIMLDLANQLIQSDQKSLQHGNTEEKKYITARMSNVNLFMSYLSNEQKAIEAYWNENPAMVIAYNRDSTAYKDQMIAQQAELTRLRTEAGL